MRAGHEQEPPLGPATNVCTQFLVLSSQRGLLPRSTSRHVFKAANTKYVIVLYCVKSVQIRLTTLLE